MRFLNRSLHRSLARRLNRRDSARLGIGARSASYQTFALAVRALRRALPTRTRFRSGVSDRDDLERRAEWLEVGRAALADFRRRPQAPLSLAQLCSLVDLFSRLGRHATGLDQPPPPPAPPCAPSLSFQEALQKIYGPAEADPSPEGGPRK